VGKGGPRLLRSEAGVEVSHAIDTLQQNDSQREEGFSIVAVQCSLIEFLESTIQGKSYRYRRDGDPQLGQYEYSNSGSL
jgi:hypothetical protein